ncbi:MAG TPA: succinate dehydrogenase, hydrophobic membrane anchor protein [Parvibaculum sp.]|jgi:succinate dehydrogenase / fumarate reductase membrane anchor subunit
MSVSKKNDMRTPYAKISHLGAAHGGTTEHIRQRVTALAIAPLAIFFLVSIVALAGTDYETAHRYLAHPLVSILLLALIGASIMHMRIGMQIVIEDYVHTDRLKQVTLIANTFFSYAVGLACVFAALKIGFGS